MKNTLRDRVLLVLKDATMDKYEKFNKAFELYRETPERSFAVETKLNRVGFTDDGLEHLLYDLQKIHNISDTDIFSASSEIEFKQAELEIALASLDALTSAKKKNKKAIANAQKVVDDLKSEIQLLNEAADLFEAEEEEAENNSNSDNSDDSGSIHDLAQKILPFTDDVNEVPEGFKLIGTEELQPIRNEYAFLDEADCPDEMFIVAGKAISAYRRHQRLHGKLQEVLEGKIELTEEEQTNLASETQEAFAENRALWDEMNHYKENKEILGKHPLFKEVVAKREVDAMTPIELSKYRGSSSKFFSEKRKALAKKDITAEKKAEIEAAIADREFRLALVNAKLGANAK